MEVLDIPVAAVDFEDNGAENLELRNQTPSVALFVASGRWLLLMPGKIDQMPLGTRDR